MKNVVYLSSLLLALFVLPVYAQFEDDEPLDPDVAFVPRVFATDANTVRAEWKILDGYYLYKEKFKFESATPGIVLGVPNYPKGKIKEDEFFGKVESYRKKVVIDIPITRQDPEVSQLVLKTVHQGCADIGLCYPPQKKSFSIELPPVEKQAMSKPASSQPTPSLFARLGSTLGLNSQSDSFLPPEKAFVLSTEVIDGNTILAQWDIEEGYYLYQNKFEFELLDSQGVTIGTIQYPQGKKKHDEYFGEMEVYYHQANIHLPLLRTDLSAKDITLLARYQGCADAGFCYPPQDQSIPLSLPAGTAGTGKVNPGLLSGSMISSAVELSEQDQIAATLSDGSVVLIMLSFFGFGLLLAFTPCVFPMIPILSSIIVGQGENLSTRKAFSMSLVYVLAMALTYTAAGVMAGLFGSNLQALFQEPWILITFSIVFVALSFSMFGFYELQLPSSWQSKLTQISNSQKGGTMAGVAIMGFLSALIVGPCVAAPLAGALIYIGQTGDAVLGGLALFALSLGMGAPLLLIGTSAGKLLPKAGGWMDAIKAAFGVMLLAVAIWLLERILPAAVTLALWAVLLIVSAIYMGALDSLGEQASGWRKLWKGLGVVFLLYGGLLLIGAASNQDDPLQPLRGMMSGSVVSGAGGAATAARSAHGLEFERVKSIEDLQARVAQATAQNRPVMLDFYADWCISCKEMERYTFTDAGVQAALGNAVLLQADVTANDAVDQAFLKHFGLFGPPGLIFYNAKGVEDRRFRIVQHVKPEPFVKHINQAFGQ